MFWQGIKSEVLENESKNTDELKSKVSRNIKYLRKCTDYTSEKALEAFEALHPVPLIISNQPDLQKVIGALLVEQHYGQLFTKMWTSLTGAIGTDHEDYHHNLAKMIATYVNFTDMSSALSAELGKTDCIPILIGVLDQQKRLSDHLNVNIHILLLNVIQNYADNICVFRRADAVRVLTKYFNHKKQKVHMYALLILAYVADETERGILQTVDGAVARLVAMLRDAVHNEDHREYHVVHSRISVLELLQGLNRLAINDANKVEIANHGGIPVFVRMLQDAGLPTFRNCLEGETSSAKRKNP